MGLGQAGPAAVVIPAEAAAEDFEEEFKIVGVAGAVDNGEGAGAECRGDLAGIVSVGPRAFDDNGGRGLGEASQEIKDAGAALFGREAGVFLEREAQVDDRDVDRGDAADDFGGLLAGGRADGADTHGLKEEGQTIGPGIGVPAGVGEEEVEAAGGVGGGGRGRIGTFRGVDPEGAEAVL